MNFSKNYSLNEPHLKDVFLYLFTKKKRKKKEKHDKMKTKLRGIENAQSLIKKYIIKVHEDCKENTIHNVKGTIGS